MYLTGREGGGVGWCWGGGGGGRREAETGRRKEGGDTARATGEEGATQPLEGEFKKSDIFGLNWTHFIIVLINS